MKPTRLKVRPYRHSATSKFVVTWSDGSRPSKAAVTAWIITHPAATEEDRKRFAAGDWTRHRRFFANKEDAQTFADGQKTKLTNEGVRGLTRSHFGG